MKRGDIVPCFILILDLEFSFWAKTWIAAIARPKKTLHQRRAFLPKVLCCQGKCCYAAVTLAYIRALSRDSNDDVVVCDTIVKLQEESRLNPEPIGLDLTSGQPINPKDAGILDNYVVKKQIINSCSVIASNLLLVDEIMRAGMSSLKG
ncbi:hypothetical protein Zmor_006435 [Zophobas morio]|uniref:Uncharacterized protein n=1 Tax=Zophobas morio TaxID=2755281 RepID=A0AA38IUY0_9CUCU|nr:hypothetical protein Zmor_006435 [Zophobas morio]